MNADSRMADIVSTTIAARTSDLQRILNANNALLLALNQMKPRPLTHRERIVGWFRMWRMRITDAWAVLTGRADICDD